MLPMSIICCVATVSGLDEATLLHGSVLEHILHNSGDRKYPIKVMLIWDTCTSYGLTQFRSDFIHCVKCNIQVKDVTNINISIGISPTLDKLFHSNVKEVFLSCVY